MDAELVEGYAPINQIMELDYMQDADMVSPQSLDQNSQFGDDQMMAAFETKDEPQEIEMMDDYQSTSLSASSLSSDPQSLILATQPVLAQAATTSDPSSLLEVDGSMAMFSNSETSPPSALTFSASTHHIPLETVQSGLSMIDPPAFDGDVYLPAPRPILATEEDVRVEVPHSPHHPHAPPLEVNETEAVAEAQLSEVTTLSNIPFSPQPASDQLPLPQSDGGVSLPTTSPLEADSNVAVKSPPNLAQSAQPDLPLSTQELSAKHGSQNESETADDSCPAGFDELATEELTSVDESLETHPIPRTDLLDHVQIDFEVLNLVDQPSADINDQIALKQAPCIRLECDGCEYSLFQGMARAPGQSEELATVLEDHVVLLGEPEYQHIYFAPLDELFESLRQLFPAFTEADHNELVLSFPDLEAKIPEVATPDTFLTRTFERH